MLGIELPSKKYELKCYKLQLCNLFKCYKPNVSQMEVIDREAFFTHEGINFSEKHLGVWELAPGKIFQNNLLLNVRKYPSRSRKMLFAINFHSGMGSMTPSSNQYCMNMEDITLILKVEILS